MLKQRIITALVMAAVFLAAIAFLPLPGLALMFGVIMAAGAWEWSRLAGWENTLARGAYVALLAALLAVLYLQLGLAQQPTREQVQPVLGLACLWWSFALLWIRSYPASATLWGNRFMRSVMGLLILAPAWAAAVFLLTFPRGGLLMVALVVVVAAADVGAYFAGKSFGKHKLAPRVSPAKTWEGFWGGAACCALLGLLLWSQLPAQADHVGLLSVLAVVLVTGVASVVGDLSVSMVKRESGCKDSGSLLPGHGGVLDRLDSLSGAAPVFALGLILIGW